MGWGCIKFGPPFKHPTETSTGSNLYENKWSKHIAMQRVEEHLLTLLSEAAQETIHEILDCTVMGNAVVAKTPPNRTNV